MNKIDYTYRNFYRFVGNGESFRVESDPASRYPDSYYQEFCRAVRHVVSLNRDKIYLMYSGGLDSEYALSVFMSLGIDITPVIVRLQPGYNDFDTDYAIKFCRNNGLTPEIIDVDFDDFVLSGKFLDVAVEAMCGLYQIPITMYAAAMLPGTVIVGSADPHCVKNIETGKWFYNDTEHVRAWTTWYDRKNIIGTPLIMGYTPEMVLAYLLDPMIVKVVNNQVPGKLGTYSSKISVFNRRFNLEPRPKFTGYEVIERSPIFQTKKFREIVQVTKPWQGEYAVPYTEMITHLTSGISQSDKTRL